MSTRTCDVCHKVRGDTMYPTRSATTCELCERRAERLHGPRCPLPARTPRPRRVAKAKAKAPKPTRRRQAAKREVVDTPFGDALDVEGRLIISIPVDRYPRWCQLHRHECLRPLPMMGYMYLGPVIVD